MTISIGDRIPAATLKTVDAEGARDVATDEVFAGKRVVLFGVPGAFTPTCSMNHLPGFLEHNDAIRAKGVDTIAVVAVNDHHVMQAWEAATGGAGRILFLADGNGEFARALGLDFDLAFAGLGTRMRRFSMVADDGVVTALNVEEGRGAEASSAAVLLAGL